MYWVSQFEAWYTVLGYQLSSHSDVGMVWCTPQEQTIHLASVITSKQNTQQYIFWKVRLRSFIQKHGVLWTADKSCNKFGQMRSKPVEGREETENRGRI